jgi:flagellar basal-body rod protein FlgC
MQNNIDNSCKDCPSAEWLKMISYYFYTILFNIPVWHDFCSNIFDRCCRFTVAGGGREVLHGYTSNIDSRELSMIDPIDSALSAITAFRKKLDVTSNNIANVKTDNFKKSRVTMQEGSQGGVQATIQKVNTPGIPHETIENGNVVEVESSNVDLAEELTEMIPTQTAYSANLKTMKTTDDMIGSLLDIIG